jgi:LysM repeat protein
MARRGPSHPGWENPPRLENFPRLRSREDRHTNQLLLYAAIGVSILMVALIMIPIIPILTSQKGSTGAASQSPGASASQSAAIASALASGSSQPGPGSSAGYLRHIVKPNENLFTIAFQNGLKVCEVQMANPGQLDNPDYIQVGQVILLPPAGLLTCPSASPSRS